MAYIINNTRGQIIAVVQDGTINTTATSLTLIGKNFTPYGEINAENTVYGLENFANSVPPINPIEGQLWYNTTQEQMYAFSGEEWKPVSGTTVSSTEPTLDPRVGDFWFNPATNNLQIYTTTSTGAAWIPVNTVALAASAPTGQVPGQLYLNSVSRQLFVFAGGTWNLIGPEAVPNFATTRWVSDTILDSAQVSRPVIRGIVNGVTVAIVSSQTFTIFPSVRPPGFTALNAGITLSTDVLLTGRASSADRLFTPRTINNVPFDGTANIVISNAGALTAGSGLTGQQYTGAVPVTWSVDATASAVAGQIVLRDSNRNFAAGTITANLVGNVQGLATNVTGVVSAVNGGTGFSSYDTGDILIGNQGTLNKGRVTGIGLITVTSTGDEILISYSGGSGTGNVSSVGITAGEGIAVSGSPITSSGSITVSNTGVTRLNSGTGISVDRTNGNITVSNTGITQVLPGPGINVSSSGGVVTVSSADTSVTSVELAGSVKLWSGASAPPGWIIADGRAISRTEFATLFSRIGTIFGAGDGSTTFNVPNLVNRVGLGAGGSYAPGSTGGSADAVVVSHTHPVTDPGHTHGGVQTFRRTPPFPTPNIEQLQAGGPDGPPSSFDQPTLSATTGISIGSAGVSGVGRNLPPYQAIYYIVKLTDAPNTGTGGGGGGIIISDDTVGSIKMWGGNLEPVSWMFCDGRTLPRAAYPELFQRIGTTFGAGDGSTTFNIPNMTNRFAVGAGGLYPAGSTGGSADAVVVSHSHNLTDPGHLHDQMYWNNPQRPFVQSNGSGPAESGFFANATNAGTLPVVRSRPASTGITISAAGESGTGKNIPPYLSARFIIKVTVTSQAVLPIDQGGTSAATAQQAINNLLPAQVGQQGNYLTSDGLNASWAPVDPGLPVQAGNAGRFLTTNGTAASWAPIPAPTQLFGVGQTWQNFVSLFFQPSSQRQPRVNYTNTTGRPIMVVISYFAIAGENPSTQNLTVDGVVVAGINISGVAPDGVLSAVVPPNGVYRFNSDFTTGFPSYRLNWSELR